MSTVDLEGPFSVDHGFTKLQVEAAAQTVAHEDPSKKLLISVTAGHRKLAMRQTVATQVAYCLVIASVYIAEHVAGSSDLHTLNVWLWASILNLAIRAWLYYEVFHVSPAEVASSNLRRLIPLACTLLSGAHLAWTTFAFIGDQPTLTVFVLFSGYVVYSVAAMGLWATAPAPIAFFLAILWLPLTVRFFQVGWMPATVLILIIVGVISLVWTYTFVAVNQVRKVLDRSDEVDLLLNKLRVANAELAEANGQLDSMRRATATELDTKSTFFSSASHDFRQRLHAMMILANAAKMSVAADGPAKALLNRLTEAVEDLEHYITSLLNFAKLDGRTASPKKVVLPLQDVFQKVELQFEDVASAQGLDLVFKATSVHVCTDPALLQSVLENLVSNALKFTRKKVLVAVRQRAGRAVIEVWDQGPGISMAVQNEIFNAFYQDSAKQPNGQKGIGLGLAVVKRFADWMSYEIQVASNLGRGTVVRVLLSPADVVKW